VKPEITYFPDLESLSLKAAHFIFQTGLKSVAKKGLFSIALSGGTTPGRLYQLLSQPPFLKEMPWKQMHFFWGDERCVPPDHSESNYYQAYQSFLSQTPLPGKNIHRIPVEKGPGTLVALAYEKELYDHLPADPVSDSKEGLRPIPSFDLILLGLGRDGHTASLFPGDPALKESEHLIAFVPRSPLAPFLPRITLTLPLINQADCVLFLVSGPDKNEALKAILTSPDSCQDHYPAAQVNPRGKVCWFVCLERTAGQP
jgi:6-phosphogluconolactonase